MIKTGLDDYLVREGKAAFLKLPRHRLTEEDVLADDHRHLSDTGNANRLAEQLQGRAIYVPETGAYYFFNGLSWPRDKTGRIVQEAKAAGRAIHKEAADENDDERRKKISRHALLSENEARIKSMIALVRPDLRVVVPQDNLDCDPNLLCVANAILDLRTGKPVPADPEHYITQQANAEYQPNAQCPSWNNFIKTILPDPKVRAYFKRAVGYSLTGHTSEQVLFFLYGGGQNGKSAVVETLTHLLGDCAASSPSSMLMRTHNDAIPNDVAALRSRRFVVLAELDTGDRLNESKVKLYTGGDVVPVRFLHREWFDLLPVFKLWMHGNHKPTIRGRDWAIWRRMGLIPFEVQIPDKDRVLDFAQKYLYPEASGILNWAIEGCLEWQKKGLAAPQRIKSEVETYREESDVLAEFIAECCETGKLYEVMSRELFKSYGVFCELGKERQFSSTKFGTMMGERFKKEHTEKGPCYHGIKLKECQKRKVAGRNY